MQNGRTTWDRLGRLMELLEENISDHPDREEFTTKLVDLLYETGTGTGGDPIGACHFSDGSCQELTEVQCITQKGKTWDGPGTHCPSGVRKATGEQVCQAR